MTDTPTCSNCNAPKIKARGLCDACYSYVRFNNGKPRPLDPEERRRRTKHTHCVNCGALRKKYGNSHSLGAKGMCKNCSEFFRKHGRMRTDADKRRSKYAKLGICKNCKQNTEHASGYCEACLIYKQRHGKNRPYRLYREECSNCHVNLNGYKTINGRCRLCGKYFLKFNRERPPKAWKAPFGFCECGDGRHPVPATHIVTVNTQTRQVTLPLCDSCYAEEMRQQSWYGAPTHDRTRTGANPSQQS